MILDKVLSLKEDIWSLRKRKVISAMVLDCGIDRQFTDLLIKYKVYRLNELRDFLRVRFDFSLTKPL